MNQAQNRAQKAAPHCRLGVRRDTADSGASLVELLVAMTLMGIAFIAILAGLGTMLRAQQQQQTIVTVDSHLRSYSEGLLAAPYINCASGYTLAAPSGFSVNVAVRYWNGDLPATFTATCPAAGDASLQQLTVVMTRTVDGWQDTLQLVKTR